jgi:hypothetical protein
VAELSPETFELTKLMEPYAPHDVPDRLIGADHEVLDACTLPRS